MKPTPKKIREAMLKEIEQDFDFSKVEKKVVTINLDEDTLLYFKKLALKSGKKYQILIRDALRYFIDEKLEPKNVWEKK